MSMIYSIIGIWLVFKIIETLNNMDRDENIKFNKKERWILGFLISIFNTLIYIKYSGIEYILYYYLLIYLSITGYIDFKTKKVYCFLNYITMAFALGYMFYQLFSGKNISIVIGSFVIYIIIILVLRILRAFASGDAEIYIAIGYFIICGNYSDLPLFTLVVNMILASFILLIFKSLYKLNGKLAFAPSIAISTLFTIVMIK